MPHAHDSLRLTMADIEAAAEAFSNWGRWGPEDEAGTLNFVGPAEVAAAAALIRKGKTFALGHDFGRNGPQPGRGERFNCVHTMMRTGLDAVRLTNSRALRYSDDQITMPLQCGTQWDALSHIFYGDHMWNGYDAWLVDSHGAHRNGIEKVKDRMVGRGVLLDVARWHGGPLAGGEAITADDLDAVARAQGVEVRRGDFVLVRTAYEEDKARAGDWTGYMGAAPGLAFGTLDWIHGREIAAIATDTWGCEVFPNETDDAFMPWHWIAIPKIGVTVGEMFFLGELAADCADDSAYEFFFCAPPLPVTRAVGSPINPMAVK
jgi:kynurenine formamidase